MAEIRAELVKELRDRTGISIMQCRKALEEAGGDLEKAIAVLQSKSGEAASKKSDRTLGAGTVASYIHSTGNVGTLVELLCETDFVAKNEGFKALANDIALHIAALSPKYLSREEVPAELVEKEKNIYREQMQGENKPAEIIEKIIDGKMGKFYSEICLLEQPFIKDEEKTIEQLLAAKTGEIGEKITIRRFARYGVGEGIEKKETDFVAEVSAQLG